MRKKTKSTTNAKEVGMGYLIKYMLGGVITIIIVCGAVYAIQALAWYRMFDMCGHYKPWAAWIPIYNLLVMCECCDADYVDLIGSIRVPMKIFRFWWIVAIVLCWVPLVGFILDLALIVLCMGWIYMNILANVRNTSPEEEMMNGYICATNPILAIIFMFKVQPVMRD